MFTLALVRFPPTATKVIQYLNAKGALTYTDIAVDPVLYGNLPPREISMKDVFRSGDSSKKFKIAEGQWYRYAPSYVSPAYHLLDFFFQAEDGIRDRNVTGVQTCALPICEGYGTSPLKYRVIIASVRLARFPNPFARSEL